MTSRRALITLLVTTATLGSAAPALALPARFRPDLTVRIVQVTSRPGGVDVSFTVMNRGFLRASSVAGARLMRNGGGQLGGELTRSVFTPGHRRADAIVQFRGRRGAAAVVVCADVGHTVRERNERNNCAWAQVHTNPANTDGSAGPSKADGQQSSELGGADVPTEGQTPATQEQPAPDPGSDGSTQGEGGGDPADPTAPSTTPPTPTAPAAPTTPVGTTFSADEAFGNFSTWGGIWHAYSGGGAVGGTYWYLENFCPGDVGHGGATWTISGLPLGTYDVQAYIPSNTPSRSGVAGAALPYGAHYTVTNTGGRADVRADQVGHGGQWIQLGRFGLNGSSTITLADDDVQNYSAQGGSCYRKYIAADGVRAVFVG